MFTHYTNSLTVNIHCEIFILPMGYIKSAQKYYKVVPQSSKGEMVSQVLRTPAHTKPWFLVRVHEII